MAAVRRNAAQNCSLYVVEGRIPPRQVAVRLSAVERERIRRATETNGCKATGRVEVAPTPARTRASPAYALLSAEHRWREKGRPGLPPRERPFIGVDGEAGYVHDRWCNVEQRGWCDCRQRYAVLTAGDQTLRNPDARPLTSWQCL